MMINPRRLWDQEGYGQDNAFDRSIQYIYLMGEKGKVPVQGINAVIAEFFVEIANGKKYPLDKCPCGCGIDKSGTAAIHELVSRLEKIKVDIETTQADLIETRVNMAIEKYIETKNAKYIESERAKWEIPPTRWEKLKTTMTDWDSSQTVRAYRKVKNGLVRNTEPGGIPGPDADE